MRLPYVPNPPIGTGLSAQEEEVVQRVQARRGPKGLIPLDLTLLHAPQVADGWNTLLGAIRTRNSLPAAWRELAILRVALINRAWFEWKSHLPILLACPEITEAHMSVIRDPAPKERGPLDSLMWAVLRYADTMTRNVEVGDELFAELRGTTKSAADGREQGLSEKEVVELTATIAAYNMVSRFLVALDVGECNGKGPD